MISVISENSKREEIPEPFKRFFDRAVRPLGYVSKGKDCLFIVPKVLKLPKGRKERNELALEFYAALRKYKIDKPQSKIFTTLPQTDGRFGSSPEEVLRVDAALNIVNFYNRHRDWFISKIQSSVRGRSIDWHRTMVHTQPLVFPNKRVVYSTLIRKGRTIADDDRLFVIYYSILRWLSEFGYPVQPFDFDIETIPTRRFERQYIDKGFGERALRQINYKYFDDTSLELWHLCMRFFESWSFDEKENKMEQLLVSEFHSIFEHIINKLLVDEELPDEIAISKELRKYDHAWVGEDPIIPEHRVIYVADSKYYNLKDLGEDTTAMHKQYVYPRNIRDNIMMLEDGALREKFVDCVFDGAARGYYIMPNCLVVPGDYNVSPFYKKIGDETFNHRLRNTFKFHHRHLLFDRDTMFLTAIMVDLKYLTRLYGQKRLQSLSADIKHFIKRTFEELVRELYNVDMMDGDLQDASMQVGEYIKHKEKTYIAKMK